MSFLWIREEEADALPWSAVRLESDLDDPAGRAAISREALKVPGTDPRSESSVAIRTIFLHVTKACNLHCRYCYFSARKPLPNELTTSEFARLWPEVVAVRPNTVVFTGGEPLLRNDILDLLADLKSADSKHSVRRCINTNGHLVTPEFARLLVGLADEVRVSLDGQTATNDNLRGAGNFDAAVRALDRFYQAGFEPKVLVTVTAINLAAIEDLVGFLLSRGITRINLNLFRPVGRGLGQPDLRLDKERFSVAISRVWDRFQPSLPAPSPSRETTCQSTCGVGRFMNIMPNGDVFPCHVLTEPQFQCGNIKRESLVEILRTDGLMRTLAKLDFRELASRDEELKPLTGTQACMADVYAATSNSPTWRDRVPLVQIDRAR